MWNSFFTLIKLSDPFIFPQLLSLYSHLISFSNIHYNKLYINPLTYTSFPIGQLHTEEDVWIGLDSAWQSGKAGQKKRRWGKGRGEVEIISAMYVFSAPRPPLANRIGGHLN